MEPEKYTIPEIVDAIKAVYSREFGKLDDQAYFMVGFIITSGIQSYIHEQRDKPKMAVISRPAK